MYKDQPVAQIAVEIYKVTDEAYLSQVDRLEGHPEWYKREPIKFVDAENKPIIAWMYMMSKPHSGNVKYNNIRITGGVAEWVRMHD